MFILDKKTNNVRTFPLTIFSDDEIPIEAPIEEYFYLGDINYPIFNISDTNEITFSNEVYINMKTKYEKGLLRLKYKPLVDDIVNQKATSLNYDSINSISKYLGYDNEFRIQCEIIGSWSASCYAKLDEIVNEQLEYTSDEFIALLPKCSL